MVSPFSTLFVLFTTHVDVRLPWSGSFVLSCHEILLTSSTLYYLLDYSGSLSLTDPRSVFNVPHPRGFTLRNYSSQLVEGSPDSVLFLVNQAMVHASQTQYQRGYNLCKEYSSLHDVDPYLMEPFEAWLTYGLDKLGLPYLVVALAAFIQWALLRKCPISGKSLSPVTVDKYAFHVRHYLLHSGVSIDLFSHPILNRLRSSVIRQYRMFHSQMEFAPTGCPRSVSGCTPGPAVTSWHYDGNLPCSCGWYRFYWFE